jgi:hypothetical protein
VHLLEMSTGRATAIPGITWAAQPRWSPYGDVIAGIGSDGMSMTLMTFTPDGSLVRMLNATRSGLLSELRWYRRPAAAMFGLTYFDYDRPGTNLNATKTGA